MGDDRCDDGSIGADGGKDDNAVDGIYVICRDSMMADSSVGPNEHTVIREHVWPWVPGGLRSEELLVGTSVRDNTYGDGAVGDGDDDEQTDNDGGRSPLPGEPAASRAYVWLWLSVNAHEKTGEIRGRQGIMVAGRHGQESTPVPNPVCLMIYIAIMLVAAYRGTPRRRIRRCRRLQRRARSSRYSQRLVNKRKELHDIAVATTPLFCARFSLFRLTSLGIHSRCLFDVDLLSESRLEKHKEGDTYFSPLDTNITTSGSNEQETSLLGIWEDVEIIFPNLKSTVNRVVASAKKSPTANLKVGPVGTCDEVKKETKPTVISMKLAGNTSKPSLKSSVDGMATPPKKEVGDVDVRLMSMYKEEMDAENIAVTQKKPTDVSTKPNFAPAGEKKKTIKDLNVGKVWCKLSHSVLVLGGFLFRSCGRQIRLRVGIGELLLDDDNLRGIHFPFALDSNEIYTRAALFPTKNLLRTRTSWTITTEPPYPRSPDPFPFLFVILTCRLRRIRYQELFRPNPLPT